MRVLQFGKFYPPHIGGIERVMFDLTEGLNARGVRCDVLCSNDQSNYVEETIKDYRVMRTRSFGVYLSASISPQLASSLKRVGSHYDIVHVHLPDPMATLALFYARPASKIVLHWHNDIVRQRFLLRLFLPFQTWMLRRSDAIVTTSPNYIDGSAHLSPYRHKCRVVPIGVDRADFEVSSRAVSEIRTRYGNRRLVFSIGRLSGYKGYRYLIEAARHLGDEYAVLIAGSGPLESELSRLVAAWGLDAKVFLLGPISHEDVGSYYEACNVYCLSSISRNEGFGLVQIEAMLFRKPVVSTNVEGSGVTWANIDGKTGLVVAPRDPAALAAAIDRVCSDREMYERFAANGHERVTAMFTRDAMISGTIEIYEELLKRPVRLAGLENP
jgi:glycosyltransferase involved in cell wall biosynthesis